MFSAFKKLGASSKPDGVVAGTTPMSGSLQKKFARGVQYNSELIIEKTYGMIYMINFVFF